MKQSMYITSITCVRIVVFVRTLIASVLLIAMFIFVGYGDAEAQTVTNSQGEVKNLHNAHVREAIENEIIFILGKLHLRVDAGSITQNNADRTLQYEWATTLSNIIKNLSSALKDVSPNNVYDVRTTL